MATSKKTQNLTHQKHAICWETTFSCSSVLFTFLTHQKVFLLSVEESTALRFQVFELNASVSESAKLKKTTHVAKLS